MKGKINIACSPFGLVRTPHIERGKTHRVCNLISSQCLPYSGVHRLEGYSWLYKYSDPVDEWYIIPQRLAEQKLKMFKYFFCFSAFLALAAATPFQDCGKTFTF